MDVIRDFILKRLYADWPATLGKWDANEKTMKVVHNDPDMPDETYEDQIRWADGVQKEPGE